MAAFVRCARIATANGSRLFRATQTNLIVRSNLVANRYISLTAARFAARKYTEGHEWITMEGNVGTVGLSHHAQDSLGDIVFVELPEEGSNFEKNDECGVVESVKAVSEIYCPVSGTVVANNKDVVEEPGLINKDCYEKGWLFKIELSNESQLNELMDEDAYKAFLESQE